MYLKSLLLSIVAAGMLAVCVGGCPPTEVVSISPPDDPPGGTPAESATAVAGTQTPGSPGSGNTPGTVNIAPSQDLGDPNPPTAAFESDRPTGHVSEPVRFDGKQSSDTNGRVASYQWDFGDGTGSTEAAPSHAFGANRSYTVTLTVTDDSGLSHAVSKPFRVQPRWTYAVYMAADNSLARFGLLDLMEMETVGSSPQVEVVVQAEFAQRHILPNQPLAPQSVGLQTYETSRFVIQKDAQANGTIDSKQQPIGNQVMSSAPALADFIRWTTTEHPADHTALVIWNHGGGWTGVCEDETAGRSLMSLVALREALQQSNAHVDIINFDACLMAMHEVAFMVAGHADYVVASQELEPGDGDPYDLILGKLVAQPDIQPRDLAAHIVGAFKQSYAADPHNGQESVTLSALDMSLFTEFDQSIGDLAVALRDALATQRAAIEAARDATQTYGLPGSRDLADFLTRFSALTSDAALRDKCRSVASLLGDRFVFANQFISGSRQGAPRVDGSHGLCVMLPRGQDVASDGSRSLEAYQAFAGDGMHPAWVEFVTALLQSAPQPDQPTPAIAADFGIAIVWADPDADVDLYVVEPNGSLSAPWLGGVTANGYFSGDSADTGMTAEIYQSRDHVEQGEFMFLANLFMPGFEYPLRFDVYYYDAAAGVNDWTLYGEGTLDFSAPAPNAWWDDSQQIPFVLGNYYSDWLLVRTITR